MKTILETERLILREYTQEDFDGLYAILSDTETMKHYPKPYDRQGTQRWLDWSLDNYKRYGFGLWAIEIKKTGEFIGDCGITMQNIDGEILPEIGYHIHRNFWRRGYAKEAATAVRDWFFVNTSFHFVYSYMTCTNVASYSTANSAGLKRIKEYVDSDGESCYVYELSRIDWAKMKRDMTLSTERLILRPWREDDAEDLYKYASDPDVGTAAGWAPHKSALESREIIRTVLSAPETYAICLKSDLKPIGSIGLHRNDIAERDDELELGYWIGKPFWGQGIIPEAARELIRHAFSTLGMNRLYCGYYEGNAKSRRVQDKLGFSYHHSTEGIYLPLLGEVRTGHVMLLLREDWLASDSQNS